MSYSFILTDNNDRLREIPISTHAHFSGFWLPLFKELNLENLTNMQFGHRVTNEELQDLVREYRIAITHITSEWELERANYIISELENINFPDFREIHVG